MADKNRSEIVPANHMSAGHAHGHAVRDSDAPEIDQKHFIMEALGAIPRWVVGLIGTTLGVGITLAFFLQVTGLAGPAHRIIDAWASKFEKAAKEVDRSVSRLDSIITRIETLEVHAKSQRSFNERIDERVTRLERDTDEQREEIRNLKAVPHSAVPRPRTPRPTQAVATTPAPAKGVFPW